MIYLVTNVFVSMGALLWIPHIKDMQILFTPWLFSPFRMPQPMTEIELLFID